MGLVLGMTVQGERNKRGEGGTEYLVKGKPNLGACGTKLFSLGNVRLRLLNQQRGT